ncbi:MAG: hypothetical protein IBJ11_12650 [Phycisphaerales bacterium]|nr:hypothetical protein [Phycisphaerales bacterium]
MNKVLPWVKSNLVTVISMAVAIIALPVMLWFSSGWNQSNLSSVQTDVSGAVSKLSGLSVSYRIPEVMPGQGEWSLSGRPNGAMTSRVVEVLKQISSDSESVRERAERHNREGKAELVPGLFSKPTSDPSQVPLVDRMIKLWPRANAELLEKAGAGRPPTGAEVFRRLSDFKAAEVRAITGGREEQKLSADEEKTLASKVADFRLGLYRAEAQRLRFYGWPAVLKSVVEWRDSAQPTDAAMWEWQHVTWINQDLIRALTKANTDATGGTLDATRGPVKRIESILVEPFPAPQNRENQGLDGGQTAAAAPAAGASSPIAPVYTVSHTGRAGYPTAPNQLYVLRYAEVVLLADVNQLPKIINAISSTNFMSVVGMDVQRYDGLQDAPQGFFYGSDALARVTLKVETIWLFSWMKPLMPASVRQKFGLPEDPKPAAGQSPDQGAAPASM